MSAVQALREAEGYQQQIERDLREKQDDCNAHSNRSQGIERDITNLQRSQGKLHTLCPKLQGQRSSHCNLTTHKACLCTDTLLRRIISSSSCVSNIVHFSNKGIGCCRGSSARLWRRPWW